VITHLAGDPEIAVPERAVSDSASWEQERRADQDHGNMSMNIP